MDDLLLAYLDDQRQRGLTPCYKSRRGSLSASEVVTILTAYHLSGYKCFEYYYHQEIKDRFAHCFPDAPSYKRFLNYIPRSLDLVTLYLLFSMAKSQRTGLYFIDSKPIPVCHLRREHSHRVFKDLARKGKSSTGWFYGFKFHLVINNLGQVVNCSFTPANVADNNKNLLQYLLNGLEGVCVGDKGYLSKLFAHFYEHKLLLLTKPRKNMKTRLQTNQNNLLLSNRGVIESCFDILTSVCNLEHTRHRSPINALVHMMCSVLAYQKLEHRPRVFFPSMKTSLPLANAA